MPLPRMDRALLATALEAAGSFYWPHFIAPFLLCQRFILLERILERPRVIKRCALRYISTLYPSDLAGAARACLKRYLPLGRDEAGLACFPWVASSWLPATSCRAK